jgi:hypothetical protein
VCPLDRLAERGERAGELPACVRVPGRLALLYRLAAAVQRVDTASCLVEVIGDRRRLLGEELVELPEAAAELLQCLRAREAGSVGGERLHLCGEPLVANGGQSIDYRAKARRLWFDGPAVHLVIEVQLAVDEVEIRPVGSAGDGTWPSSYRDASGGW